MTDNPLLNSYIGMQNEKMIEALSTVATLLRTYSECLRAAGFNQKETLALTQQFQATIWGNSLKKDGGK